MSVPNLLASPPGGADPDDGTLADLALALARYRVMLVAGPLGSALVAAIVSLLLPLEYTGVARILPPQQSSTSAALLSQAGGLASLAGGALGLRSPAETFVGILQGDTITDAVIARFDLKKLYDVTHQLDARKALRQRVRFSANSKSGIITVEADARDPTLAADIANAFTEELHKVLTKVAITDAAQRRLFFERQLEQTKERLSEAEAALQQAMGSGGLVSVDLLGRAAVENVARLRALISSKELQISAMRAYAARDNPELQRADAELSSLRAQLAQLESGHRIAVRDEHAPTSAGNSGVNNIRLLRDVKYNEVLFDIVARQYELARVDESREAPLLQVFDRAAPPDRRSRPQRTLIVIVTFFVALVLCIFVALVRHQLDLIQQDPLSRNKLALVRAAWWLGSNPPPDRPSASSPSTR